MSDWNHTLRATRLIIMGGNSALIQPGGAEGHRINAIRGKPSGVGSPARRKAPGSAGPTRKS